MHKLVLPLFVISTLISSSAICARENADVTPVLDPAQHVRIEHNQFNTPDSIIFDVLLDMIRTNNESLTEAELESWVFGQMNATYDQELGAWATSKAESLRYTRDDIAELTALLVDVAYKSFETSLASQRNLFCPEGKSLDMEEKLAALEQRIIDRRVDADFYLETTMDKIGEAASSDLRAWLSRVKAGYRAREYNYRTLWAGREAELDAQLSDYCLALEANK